MDAEILKINLFEYSEVHAILEWKDGYIKKTCFTGQYIKTSESKGLDPKKYVVSSISTSLTGGDYSGSVKLTMFPLGS